MGDTMLLKKIFGKNVKYYRLEKKLSQEKFCELTDISVGFLSHIETGRENPSFETISKFATVLDVKVSTLFDESILDKNIPNRITDI